MRILLVILLLLATGCRSVKKSRTYTENISADKKTTDSTFLSAKSSDTSEYTNAVSNINSKLYSNTLGIEYTPTFDTSGNLLPFNYSAVDGKGNKTQVNIVGPGKVINTIIDRDEETLSSIMEQRRVRWKEVDSILAKLETQIDHTSSTLEETKSVAPDYLKYIIWMGAGMVMLLLLLLGLYLYFKSTIGKLKALIP